MRLMKLTMMSVLALVALAASACLSGTGEEKATPTPTAVVDGSTGDTGAGGIESFAAADGNFVVLISDEENAIGDFAHLWVYIDRVGVQVAGEDTAWLEFDVPIENQVVDLTQFVGDDATSLVQANLPAGDYQKIFVRVEDVEGELATGETVSVKLPSSRLKLNQPFTVGGDEVTPFVFDISVIAAGNEKAGVKYILKPIVGESGSKKSFSLKSQKRESNLNVVVTDPAAEGDGHVVTVTDDAGNPVADAAIEVEVELLPLITNADGEVVFGVPANAEKIKAEAELGEGEGEIRLVVGEAPEAGEHDEDASLVIEVVGEIVAGEPATLRVTDAAGAPVVGAEVEVEVEIVAGVTGADGTLTVVIPADAAKVEAEARTADGRGNTERKGRRDHEDGREHDDATGDHDAEGKLTIGVEGEAVAGAEIVLVVTDESGVAVEGADVEVNDVIVGSTDVDGKLTLTLPTGEEKAEIDVKLGEAEGELEIEL